jgi:P-type E1-E2 ATPase
VVIGLVLGALATVVVGTEVGRVVFVFVLVLGTLPYLWRMVNDLRRGHFGVDVIAMLAILTALKLNELIAGSVILLMLSGGEALEEYALARARLKLTELLSRAPSLAHREQGKMLQDIPVDQVKIGDALLVKFGETIPVDGVIVKGVSVIDESMLTGESLPVEKRLSQPVLSGSVNVGSLFTMRVTQESKNSRYQQIVRLVRDAEANKAPLVRLADQYSGWFTLVTLVCAGLAWALSGDPLRALAVLVVATPCPLIIATPVAVMSGISLAATRGIIVKNGGALELLGRVRAFVFG